MLIPFPIAFFVSTLVVDLVFWRTGNADWASASVWLLGAGLAMAALAAVAGLIDLLGDHRIREKSAVWWHAGGNIVAVLLSLWNFLKRQGAPDLALAILPGGLLISLAVVAILLVTGWLGWELVYRGKVGVAD